MDGGAWWAAVHGVVKSWTWLSNFTFTFHFHALEKEMATHSSVLAWRIPGTEEPGGLPSMGSHRVGHNWSDLAVAVAMGFPDSSTGKEPSFHAGDTGDDGSIPGLKFPWKRKWQSTPVFLPEKSHGQRSLVATVERITESQTLLNE